MGPRAKVDAALDWARFRLDTFPRLDYQPIPAAGLHQAKRDGGVHSRWQAIERALDDVAEHPLTALDLGANVGFFSFQLAERGYRVMSVEQEGKFFRPLRRMAGRFEGPGLVVPTATTVDERSVALLPDVGVTIFLSVWHHIVRWNGMATAMDVLGTVWSRTHGVLFFESGEHELDDSWGDGDPVGHLGCRLRGRRAGRRLPGGAGRSAG